MKVGLRWGLVGMGLFAAIAFSSACGSSDDTGGGSSGKGGTDGGKGGSGGTGKGGTSGTGATGGGGTTGGGGAGGGTAGAGGGTAGAGGVGGTGGSTSLFDCTAASGSMPTLTLTEFASGFSNPLFAESPPGDPTRMFVIEQPGTIKLVQGGQTTTFLDISGHVQSGGNEQGLLGLAFHPGFPQNPKFYVYYTADGTTAPDGDELIAEFSVQSGNQDVADPSSEKLIFTQTDPESNHNGGGLHFGSDGMLWLGVGDGGGGCDQHGSTGNGQSLDTGLGKILRFDVDNPSGGKAYGIPSGNMSGSNVWPEIWSYGLRNPWRWAFDPCTDDMYIGDVGQNTYEEIDVEPKGTGSGTNYGWRIMEGMHCSNQSCGGSANCDMTGLTLPVVEYDHGSGCSVTGGYVYRGHNISALKGTYLYADYCSGRFWSFVYSGGTASNAQEITSNINPGQSVKNITSFGQDANGELYVVARGGTVYRIDAQ